MASYASVASSTEGHVRCLLPASDMMQEKYLAGLRRLQLLPQRHRQPVPPRTPGPGAVSALYNSLLKARFLVSFLRCMSLLKRKISTC